MILAPGLERPVAERKARLGLAVAVNQPQPDPPQDRRARLGLHALLTGPPPSAAPDPPESPDRGPTAPAP